MLENKGRTLKEWDKDMVRKAQNIFFFKKKCFILPWVPVKSKHLNDWLLHLFALCVYVYICVCVASDLTHAKACSPLFSYIPDPIHFFKNGFFCCLFLWGQVWFHFLFLKCHWYGKECKLHEGKGFVLFNVVSSNTLKSRWDTKNACHICWMKFYLCFPFPEHIPLSFLRSQHRIISHRKTKRAMSHMCSPLFCHWWAMCSMKCFLA